MHILRKNFQYNKNITYNSINGVEIIQFNNLKKYESIISHGFTTRIGGVSTGECSSLNMGFNRNDTRENVLENYRRVASALNIDCNNMVLSKQVHDSKIKSVDEEDRGKGIFKENDLHGYDGLMTDKRNVALVTFYADCVPLLFFDPEKKVIAESHSGWRGTLKEIAKETIIAMNREYGCNAENIIAAIGPSIGECCFEVGKEVYDEFKARHQDIDEYCKWLNDDNLKIDLQRFIKRTMINQGIREENICMSEICTKCNNDIFFSHRGDNGRTGSMTSIMQLL